jgi:hypothetical protein
MNERALPKAVISSSRGFLHSNAAGYKRKRPERFYSPRPLSGGG